MSMDVYTIGQIAERTGFTASALRYYEKQGLIEPVDRTSAGYRIYDDTSVARLEFVARAKQLGCTLEEVRELARLWDGDDCGPVQRRLHELVTAKVTEAQTRAGELVRFTAQLHAAAVRLGSEPVDGPCSDGCACLGDASSQGPEQREDAVPVLVGEKPDPTIACTLPADEMPDRMRNWQSVLAAVGHRARLDDGGLRLTFSSPGAPEELVRLATAEQSCCSFFSFAITVDHRGVALEVRAPDEAAGLVTSVFGAAA